MPNATVVDEIIFTTAQRDAAENTQAEGDMIAVAATHRGQPRCLTG